MQRFFESAAFPLIAGALGAGVSFLSKAFGASTPEAMAMGAALFAAALALRNFLEVQSDRPLLAEELSGLHDRVEVLQEDAADLRELLTDLASIVEESAARDQAAMRAVETRLIALEENPAEDVQADALRSIQEAVEPLTDRLEHFDARTRKLALAIEKGLRAAGDGAEKGQETAPEAAAGPVAEAVSRIEAAPEPELKAEQNPLKAPTASEPPVFDEEARAFGENFALMMQAVFSVPDGEPRFFEAFTRRVGRDGQVAAAADHIAEAKAQGRMGEIDNLLLVRCVAAAEQLREGGRDVAVFCNLSIQSLRDPAYLRAFVSFLRKNSALSRYLVFEFDQTELEDFYDADIDILQRLRETGFVFSIDHLEDWSIDINNLAKIGFRYVKLDAAALLEREERGPGAIERLSQLFKKSGLSLIVEKVGSVEEAKLLEAAGARFLQGQGLAEPRLIRVDDQNFLELEQAARKAVSSGRGLTDRGGDGGGSAAAADAPARPEDGQQDSRRAKSDGLERALQAVGRQLGAGVWPLNAEPARRRPD